MAAQACPKCGGEIEIKPRKNRKGQFGKCRNCGRLVSGGKAENSEGGGPKAGAQESIKKPVSAAAKPVAASGGTKRPAARTGATGAGKRRPVRPRPRIQQTEQRDTPKRDGFLAKLGRFLNSDL